MSAQTIASADDEISFGQFRFFPARQLLMEAEKPVRLGSRALDILGVLVRLRGELISTRDLIAKIWPDTFVEEGNLRVHIAALRRALGDGRAGNRYVVNVPGRGYRFLAPVSISRTSGAGLPQDTAAEPAHNLPSPLQRMVGRAETVSAVLAHFARYRLVTIVGAGGIGKTTVALAAANELIASFKDRVRFIDLAPLTDRSAITSALASLCDVTVRSEDAFPALIAHLKDKEVLLVLDGCEHVVEAAAALAEAIVTGAPRVRILATSREPLRSQGEAVMRLPPLGLPPPSAGLTAAEALTFPAIQLFVECAAASLDGFELSEADASIACDICRKLDGIALAIELAASRVDALGVRGVADHLDDRFRLLTSGRRTALPRHQTLGATLDWSYELLPSHLRVILRRVGIFAGWFSSEAASAVARDEILTASEVITAVADLVAKSLVAADVSGATAFYRLLDTTRAYAFQKLTQAGEVQRVSRAHAGYYCALFERAEAEWETRPTADWLADYGRKLDNLRVALDWAFSPSGDLAVGVPLTVAAVPLWFQLSLINECRQRVERALAAVDPETGRDEHREMKLRAALGWSLMYTTGPERPTSSAWQTAFELAEKVDDVDYQLRALWGLWASRINNGEFGQALAFAERFSACASHGSPERHIADRLIGTALHFLGDQPGARLHLERMLSRYVPPDHRSHIVRFQFDQRVSARMTLARVLWLQGFADQALREASSNIDEALAVDHTLSLCNALGNSACPVALFAGDLGAAERYTGMLSGLTERHGFDAWRAYADVFRGELLARRGELDSGLALLHTAVGKLRDAKFVQYQTAFLLMLAQSLARAGRLEEGRAALDEALQQCERTDERWCMSELLRVRGEIALLEPTPDRAAAERDFEAALVLARRQQALSWELRSAISLARLRRKEGRIAEARSLLAPVSGRFTEGFGTADLHAANGLLTELA